MKDPWKIRLYKDSETLREFESYQEEWFNVNQIIVGDDYFIYSPTQSRGKNITFICYPETITLKVDNVNELR